MANIVMLTIIASFAAGVGLNLLVYGNVIPVCSKALPVVGAVGCPVMMRPDKQAVTDAALQYEQAVVDLRRRQIQCDATALSTHHSRPLRPGTYARCLLADVRAVQDAYSTARLQFERVRPHVGLRCASTLDSLQAFQSQHVALVRRLATVRNVSFASSATLFALEDRMLGVNRSSVAQLAHLNKVC